MIMMTMMMMMMMMMTVGLRDHDRDDLDEGGVLHVYGKTANTGNTIGPENKEMIVMIKMAHTAATEIEEGLSERSEIRVPSSTKLSFFL